MTLESHHKLLPENVIPELENQEHLKKDIFQQDDARPRTADVILMLLQKTFKKCVISNCFPRLFNSGWLWPPYSLDLNPCNHFLCGCIKDKVYRNNTAMLEELEAEILRCVHTMPHIRMQHNAASPCGKNSSAYAAKLITSTLKKNFLPTIFQFSAIIFCEVASRIEFIEIIRHCLMN